MTKYHISSRIIHWIMALIILSALFLGVYMTDFLPEDASNKMEIYGLHKSLGVMALIFIAIRIFKNIVCQVCNCLLFSFNARIILIT